MSYRIQTFRDHTIKCELSSEEFMCGLGDVRMYVYIRTSFIQLSMNELKPGLANMSDSTKGNISQAKKSIQ